MKTIKGYQKILHLFFTLSISAGVGFTALSAIAALYGLVMISFIKQQLEETDD